MITTQQLLDILNNNNQSDINQLLNIVPNISFIDYLNALMENKQITKSELIIKADLYRTYAYQIFNGKKVPSRNKVIKIALAMHLKINETNNLLSLSNNGSLYPKVRFDAIILFALNNNYDVIKTNILLSEYDYIIE